MEVEEMFNGRMKRRTYTAEAANANAEKFGWTEVPDAPTFDNNTQHRGWDRENLEWIVRDLTQDELDKKKAEKFKSLRERRDRFLRESDWSQLLYAEATDTEVAIYGYRDSQIKDFIAREWAEYRQQLRDLPENTEDLNYIMWPAPPFLTGFEDEADLEMMGVTATGDTIV
tara:strand:- start:264 stop:776 length:513 start_codon:yes stop_codon:yes gene_type:complete